MRNDYEKSILGKFSELITLQRELSRENAKWLRGNLRSANEEIGRLRNILERKGEQI